MIDCEPNTLTMFDMKDYYFILKCFLLEKGRMFGQKFYILAKTRYLEQWSGLIDIEF